MPVQALSIPVPRQAIPSVLHAHHILPTAQRVEIAALLLAEKQHLSADQVLVRLRAMGAIVSKATVYNTLGLFAARGLVREVIVDPVKTFYDSNMEPHHHFYNVDEGTLLDFDVGHLPLDRTPESPAGTYAEGVDIVVRIRNQR